MKIADVEKEINVTKANIRYYEKEGLLSPTRKENKYRDYTDEDIERIKEIVILRKTGISIANIKRLFNNEIDLKTASEESLCEMQKQLEELNGSIRLCMQIQNANTELTSLDIDYYWNKIIDDEKQGLHFVDTLRDYSEFEKSLILAMLHLDDENRRYKATEIVIVFLIISVFSGVLFGFVFKSTTFLEGFLTPLIIFAVISVILLPVFIFRNKQVKFISGYLTFLFVLAIIFIISMFSIIAYFMLFR